VVARLDDRPLRILVVAASRRDGSLNGRLARLAAEVVRRWGAIVDVGSMREFDPPSYDGDAEREQGIPPEALAFADRLTRCDACVFASPEYNGSMPGVLKNAIDWVSRLRPQPFDERHALLLSASPSMMGGNRGLWALRVPLEHLGMRVYPDMFSLARAHRAFGDDGDLADPTLKERFYDTIEGFLALVEASVRYPHVKRAWVEFLGETPDPAADRVEARR
jgi:NAD(P)H-dependent FMN reductase